MSSSTGHAPTARAAGGAIGMMSWLLMIATLSSAAVADDGCEGYEFDVGHEIEQLQQTPAEISAGTTAGGGLPALEVNRAHRLRLAPQGAVRFALAPERRTLDEGAMAGMIAFSVPLTGTWRVALSDASWVDVVAQDGRPVESRRFAGRAACVALRKVVEFPLLAGAQYVLQLSGGTDVAPRVLLSGPVTDRR